MIYNIDRQYVELDKAWFAWMEEMTTLQLRKWRHHGYGPRTHHVQLINGELLGSIGVCRNLRYRSFGGIFRIEALPDSISDLCNLIVLDLWSCHNLAMLSKRIKSLASLEYLDVSGCYLLGEMPKGIRKLSKLHVIKGFMVANSSSKDPCYLTELSALTRLRKLSIMIGMTARPKPDVFMALASLTALQSLTMTWSGVSPPEQVGRTGESRGGNTSDKKMAFVLSSGLQKLDVRCFSVPDFLRWPEPHLLPRLEKLYVRGGMVTGLGSSGSSAVKVLRVRYLRHLYYSWEKLHDVYRKLDIMEVCECSNTQAWPACHGGLWRKRDD